MPYYPFRYTLYGLTLACNAPLAAPGLCRNRGGAATGPVNVLVDWAGVTADGEQAVASVESPTASGTRLIVEETGGWLAIVPSTQLENGWTCLRFGYAEHYVQFDIASDGAQVVVTWTAAVLPAHICTLLFSTVMNYLLYTQGKLALHAGVVAWKEVAFAFVGAQGTGKSTTVSALIQRGCTSVADDIAALTRQPSGWAVYPGLTGIRLTPQTQAALGIPASAATPLWPRLLHSTEDEDQKLVDKSVVTVAETKDSPPMDAALSLAGLFVLPPRSDTLAAPRIMTLAAAATMPHLIEHLLTPAWLNVTIDQKHFMTLVDLARHTPMRMVDRPNALAALPQMCDELLDEMERLRKLANTKSVHSDHVVHVA